MQPIRTTIQLIGLLVALRASALAAGPGIALSNVNAAPGDQVLISATLSTCGCSLAGTQHDFTYGTAENGYITGVRKSNGKPDCTVNAAIDKGSTSFAFQPPSCTADTCTAVRAIVFSTDNTDPIPDGSVLYTCKIQVAADAPDGVYPLTSRSGLGGVCGPTLGDPSCMGDRNGSVTVDAPPTVCAGNCNGDEVVTVDEILILVNIAQGSAEPSSCPSGIPSGTAVDVGLIIQAVNHAQSGCTGS